jgi:catechol 2,3-dioxygenase-like lactoylglutathione lyase family enzyme
LLCALLLAATILALAHPVVPQSQGENPEIVRLRYATIVVPDYDAALRWYTEVLGLEKVEERTFGAGYRWLVLAPHGQKDFGIILEIAKPIDDQMAKSFAGQKDNLRNYSERIGKETRWVFDVKDCYKFYNVLANRGVKFVEPPVDQPWGVTEAQFVDLYGNVFVVSSPTPRPNAAK